LGWQSWSRQHCLSRTVHRPSEPVASAAATPSQHAGNKQADHRHAPRQLPWFARLVRERAKGHTGSQSERGKPPLFFSAQSVELLKLRLTRQDAVTATADEARLRGQEAQLAAMWLLG